MSAMHSALKEKGYLCDKDIKGKSLCLRVEVFEVAVRDSLFPIHPSLMLMPFHIEGGFGLCRRQRR